MSWLSPRAVRRRRFAKPRTASRPMLAVTHLESRVNPTNVLQYHMDSISSGVNYSETVLTPSNVNEATFGKLLQLPVTGEVYAEPLVETGVNITVGASQGLHNVVFIGTEADQLYAYDADSSTPQLLWHRSLLTPQGSDPAGTLYGTSYDDNTTTGVHTYGYGDFLMTGDTALPVYYQNLTPNPDITPEVGITATPVIDPNTAIMYVEAKMSETVAGVQHYVQRLYAINIQTGADQTMPFLIGDTTNSGSTYVNYAFDGTSWTNNGQSGSTAVASGFTASGFQTAATNQIWTFGVGAGTNDHVTDPYTGSGQNVVQFNAQRQLDRPGIDEVNGVLYLAFASHGDNSPYHGWMVAITPYTSSSPTMTLAGVLNTTPNANLGGIWQAGGEITYADGYFYFETGNGTFDGNNGSSGSGSDPAAPAPGPITGINSAGFPVSGDYADSFVKVGVQSYDSTHATEPGGSPLFQNIMNGSTTGATNPVTGQPIAGNGWGLDVVDYFTPYNQLWLTNGDHDLGSSAVVLVPDYNTTIGGTNQLASASTPHLMVGSGKEGVIYLINRDNMGKYGLTNNIVQNTANQLSGSLDSAALYNNQMFYVQGYGGVGKEFNFSNGAFATTASTQSVDQYAFAGSTPMISANNGTNGIVWDVDRGTNQLRAYNAATGYSQEIYTSAQAPNNRDTLGAAVKFEVTTVANGRVYVGAGNLGSGYLGSTDDPTGVQNGDFVDVYGLLAPPTNVPNDPSGLLAQPASSTQITVSWTDNSVSPNNATSFTIQRSVDGGAFSTLATSLTTNYADTSVTSGHTYTYRVYAVDGFGSSVNPTNVSSASVPASGPHTIDYSAGFTTTNTTAGSTHGGFQFNGATQTTIVTGNVLRLTSNGGNQARSVWYTYPSDPTGHSGKMYIGSFTTTYTYNLSSSGNGPADGVTFTIQNDSRGLTALGGGGGQLGYGTTTQITPSVALALNVYGGNALGTEILQNGVVDENFTETNINTQTVNAPITITIGYAAGILTVSETQTRSGTVFTDTKTMALNIPSILGTDYGIVGFTGATGGADSTQNITNWTFDQGVVPQPPTNLQATVTGYQGTSNTGVPLGANLTWNAVTDTPSAGGPISYAVLRSLNATGPFAQIGTSNTTSYSDAGLVTGTTYYYQVQAADTYADSIPSASTSITTPTLPPTPTNSQINSITNTTFSFQWQNNANNANGYLIEENAGSGTFNIIANLAPDNNNVPGNMTYTATGLTPGTHYDFHIQSYNLAGYSDFAGVSGTTTAPAPSNLVATGNTSGTIGLSWNGVGGSATYNVYRGTSPGGEGATPIATGLSTLSYTDSSLAFGTTYYYEVTATNSGVETATSNEASAFASGQTQTALQVSPNPATPTQTVTLTATVTSGGGTPTTGSVQFSDNGSVLQIVSVNASGVATYQTTFGVGTHSLTATYAGTPGFATSSTTQAVTETVANPTTVAGIQVNDGSAQRSEVRSITITFSGPVTFAAGNTAAAFQLVHTSNLSGSLNNMVTLGASTFPDSQGRTVVVLTFSGSETDPNSAMNGNAANPSLSDGRYQLTIFGSSITDSNGLAVDAAGNGTPGSNYVSPSDLSGPGLFRLYGDYDGNGVVNAFDFAQFRLAYGSSSTDPAYVAFFDADGNGAINAFDFAQFRLRYGSSV